MPEAAAGNRALSRRTAILVTAAGLAAAPAAVSAQRAGRVYRLGFIVQPPRENFGALFDELRRSGFTEGNNLIVDGRGFGLGAEQLNEIAVEVAKAEPDAIYAGGTAAGRAARRATGTIPLVVLADDMVGAQLAKSLSHPGGNVTGISILATELDGKRLELLAEMVPRVGRVGAVWDAGTTAVDQIQKLTGMAQDRGITLLSFRVARASEILPAIDAAKAAGVQALDVLASALFHANRAAMIAHIGELALPAVYQWPEYGQEGALICYGPSVTSFYRQAARLIAKVLNGTKPADIPVEQPTQIDLIVNKKTATRLGLEIPLSILARATDLIE